MTTATLTSSADNNGSRRQCLTPRVRRLPEAIDLRHMFVHVAECRHLLHVAIAKVATTTHHQHGGSAPYAATPANW
jgi:hypothetical protein